MPVWKLAIAGSIAGAAGGRMFEAVSRSKPVTDLSTKLLVILQTSFWSG